MTVDANTFLLGLRHWEKGWDTAHRFHLFSGLTQTIDVDAPVADTMLDVDKEHARAFRNGWNAYMGAAIACQSPPSPASPGTSPGR